MNNQEKIKWILVGNKYEELKKKHPEWSIAERLVEAHNKVKAEMGIKNANS